MVGSCATWQNWQGKFGRLVGYRPLTDEGGGSAVGFLLYTIRLTEHVKKKQASKQKEPGPRFIKTKMTAQNFVKTKNLVPLSFSYASWAGGDSGTWFVTHFGFWSSPSDLDPPLSLSLSLFLLFPLGWVLCLMVPSSKSPVQKLDIKQANSAAT